MLHNREVCTDIKCVQPNDKSKSSISLKDLFIDSQSSSSFLIFFGGDAVIEVFNLLPLALVPDLPSFICWLISFLTSLWFLFGIFFKMNSQTSLCPHSVARSNGVWPLWWSTNDDFWDDVIVAHQAVVGSSVQCVKCLLEASNNRERMLTV